MKIDGKRKQDIDIFYNAVGVIDIPTEEEMDEMIAEHAVRKQRKPKQPSQSA